MSDVLGVRPKIIGVRVKRTEDPRLLTGRGSFVDDRQTSNALHVAFRRSEHAHARVVSIDCEVARAAPGVIAVFTADDLAVNPLVAASRMKGYHATPILPLARRKVRHVGEPIVGVIAASRYLAEDAAELIEIAFEQLAHAVDPAEAVKPDAPLLHEEAHTNVLVAREFKRGDVDAAMEAAPVRVSGRFRMRRKSAVAIEPRCCLAEYDAGRDAFRDAGARYRARRTMRGARSARSPVACGRARCRRRLRWQGLALSRGNLCLRGGTQARPRG